VFLLTKASSRASRPKGRKREVDRAERPRRLPRYREERIVTVADCLPRGDIGQYRRGIIGAGIVGDRAAQEAACPLGDAALDLPTDGVPQIVARQRPHLGLVTERITPF
jgi:hypothetical protein